MILPKRPYQGGSMLTINARALRFAFAGAHNHHLGGARRTICYWVRTASVQGNHQGSGNRQELRSGRRF